VSLAGFACFSPLQASIHPLLAYSQWPSLGDYQHYLNASPDTICNSQSQVLKIVAQDQQQKNFVDRYAARIFLRGEMQTREQNWHDFFQVITWQAFPKTKKHINARQYRAAEQRFTREGNSGRRSDTENLLSLFDECGAIIVADDEKHLELIRQHHWKDIFWDNKDLWSNHLQCYVFGHAMHEKALIPYLGMTTHTIMFTQEPVFFQKELSEKLSDIDQIITDIWLNKKIEKTKDLQPVPLLGIPGWWKKEQTDEFYENKNYFRIKR